MVEFGFGKKAKPESVFEKSGIRSRYPDLNISRIILRTELLFHNLMRSVPADCVRGRLRDLHTDFILQFFITIQLRDLGEGGGLFANAPHPSVHAMV